MINQFTNIMFIIAGNLLLQTNSFYIINSTPLTSQIALH